MKKYFLTACVLFLCSGAAWADRGDQYLIAKLGVMQVDLNNADPLFSVGAYYGYGLMRNVSLEAEANFGFLGGKFAAPNPANSGEYNIWTLAGYGVYRLPITEVFYGKGKLGLLYENVENTGVDKTATDFGLAGGLGAGYVVGERMTLEAEATVIDQDIIFWSLGVHYSF